MVDVLICDEHTIVYIRAFLKTLSLNERLAILGQFKKIPSRSRSYAKGFFEKVKDLFPFLRMYDSLIPQA